MHLVKSNLCQTTVVSLWLVIPRPFNLSRETPSSFNCSVTAWFCTAITTNLLIINICVLVEGYLDAGLNWFKEFERVLFHPAETEQVQEHVYMDQGPFVILWISEKMKSKIAKPLVGKQLLDLLLVLSNHLTTSSFKHHKPDVFGRSGTIQESESGAVERKKWKEPIDKQLTLYWTSPGRLPRPMQSCWRPQRCSVLHLKTVARWLCKGMGFSTLGYTGSSWASQWCVTCPWSLLLN